MSRFPFPLKTNTFSRRTLGLTREACQTSLCRRQTPNGLLVITSSPITVIYQASFGANVDRIGPKPIWLWWARATQLSMAKSPCAHAYNIRGDFGRQA